MPRKSGLQSLLMNLRKQGAKTLAALQQEITKREQELESLQSTATRWIDALSGPTGPLRAAASLRTRAGKKRRRLDWNVILAGLPATFNAKDVRQKSGKPLEQVYSGLSRWVKDKKIKRSAKGIYQKIGASPAMPQKKG